MGLEVRLNKAVIQVTSHGLEVDIDSWKGVAVVLLGYFWKYGPHMLVGLVHLS